MFLHRESTKNKSQQKLGFLNQEKIGSFNQFQWNWEDNGRIDDEEYESPGSEP